MSGAHDLHEAFVHLGGGASAVPQPPFTGIEWYEGYIQRHGGEGAEGRLVSMYRFDTPWDAWEKHPAGDELVVCTSGRITLIQELPGQGEVRIAIGAGEYAINPAGIWHTADVSGPAEALFVTSGIGTEHRTR